MKLLLIACTAMLPVFAWCQTKEIAFKSHSGKTAAFHMALENEYFATDKCDFGVLPTTVKDASLDSVIFVSDSQAIMVTSIYCRPFRSTKPNPRERSLWSAGRQLVKYHPLFSKRHSLDSIRSVIKKEYHFQNDVKGIVFIGYDNANPQQCDDQQQYQWMPASFSDDHNNTPFDQTFYIMLCSVFVLSGLAALILWKRGLVVRM